MIGVVALHSVDKLKYPLTYPNVIITTDIDRSTHVNTKTCKTKINSTMLQHKST